MDKVSLAELGFRTTCGVWSGRWRRRELWWWTNYGGEVDLGGAAIA